jgi:hypothetical protein
MPQILSDWPSLVPQVCVCSMDANQCWGTLALGAFFFCFPIRCCPCTKQRVPPLRFSSPSGMRSSGRDDNPQVTKAGPLPCCWFFGQCRGEDAGAHTWNHSISREHNCSMNSWRRGLLTSRSPGRL